MKKMILNGTGQTTLAGNFKMRMYFMNIHMSREEYAGWCLN